MTEEEVGFLSSIPCLAIYFGNKKYNTIWKMPSVLLSDYLAADLSGPDPWSDDVVMFTPYTAQLSLHDFANCRAFETLFKMCGIEYRVEEHINTEFMSSPGKVPVVSCGSFIFTELERVATFLKDKGYHIGDHLTEEKDRSDMRTFLSPIRILAYAELYLCWTDELIYQSDTKRRYGSVHPFPLNSFLPWMKRRQILNELTVFDWMNKTLNKVYTEVNNCLTTFAYRLGDSKWLFGEKPTEVDALLYGHLFAILNTDLPRVELKQTVENFPSLISYYERIQKAYFG